MLKKIQYIVFPILFIIFIISIVVFSWNLDSRLILGHDVGYRLNSKDFFTSLFYLWSDTVNFGGAKYVNPGAIPIHLPEFILESISGNLYLNQFVLVIFWQMLLFSPFLIIYFSYFYNKDPKSIVFFIFAAVLYAINFFNLQGWGVFWRTRFSTQIIVPIFFAVLLKTLIDKKVSYPLVILLIFASAFLNGGGSPPLYAPMLLVWGITFLFFLAVDNKRKKLIFTFITFTLLYFLGFALVSAFWMYPYGSSVLESYSEYVERVGGLQSAIKWLEVVAAGSSFINIFRLQGFPSWYDNPSHPYAQYFRNNEILVFASFIFPILAVSSYLFAKTSLQRRFVLLFYVFILVGAFFTSGSHPPLGWLYKTLFQHVPGFSIFRTPFYKFGPLVWFGLSVLAAFTLYQIGVWLRNKTRLRIAYGTYIIVVIFTILAYHFPYFSSAFFKWDKDFSTLVHVPGYVFDFKKWSEENKHTVNGRILLAPQLEKTFNADAYTWGYWSLDSLQSMISSLTFVEGQTGDPVVSNMISELHKALIEGNNNKITQLSTLLDIEYILLKQDTFYNYKGRETTNPVKIRKALENNISISHVQSFGKWDLYRILEYKPSRFFTVDTMTEFVGDKNQIDREIDFAQNAFIIAGDKKNTPYEDTLEIQKVIVLPGLIDTASQGDIIMQKSIPRVYPDSFLYPLVEWKRNQEKKNLEDNAQIINYYLGTTAKYIHELAYLERDDKPGVDDQVEKILDSLDSLHDLLATSDSRDSSSVQIYFFVMDYLNAYEGRMVNLSRSYIGKNMLIIMKIRDLKSFVTKTSNRIIECVFFCQIYSVDFPTKGQYEILVHKDTLPTIRSLYLDNQALIDSAPPNLQQESQNDWVSIAKIERPQEAGFLTVVRKENQFTDTLSLNGQSRTVAINESRHSFNLAYNYVIENDNAYVFTLHFKNNSSGNTWSESKEISGSKPGFDTIYLHHEGDILEKISIIPLSVNARSPQAYIDNIRIIPNTELDLVFVKINKNSKSTLQPVMYGKDNPSRWYVNSLPDGLRYLVSSQKYNQGWSINEKSSHIRVNGDFNAWAMQDVPKDKIAVEFTPQRNLVTGFIVSGVSIILFIILLFLTLRRYEK